MMNLWGMNDLFGAFNQAVDVARQATDAAKQLAPAVDQVWSSVDPSSYNQAGGLSGILDVADQTIGAADQGADWLTGALSGLDWQQQ
jgi:hypothetical protein